MQASHVIFAAVGAGLCLGALLAWRIHAVKAEAASIWAIRDAEGTVPKGASRAAFTKAWERAYFPRATLYALVILVVTLIAVPLFAALTNEVWFRIWNASFADEIVPARVSGSLDTGSLVHGLLGTLVTIGATVLTYIPIMARYQRRRPGRFETELARAMAAAGHDIPASERSPT